MVAAAATIQALCAGGDTERIQRTHGEVAGDDVYRAAEEREDAGQFRQAIRAETVVDLQAAPTPAADQQVTESLFASVILSPGVEVEVAGNEQVPLAQQGRCVFGGVAVE